MKMRGAFGGMGTAVAVMMWTALPSSASAEDAVCLAQPIALADEVLEGCISKEKAAALLDQPIAIGDSEEDRGLTLTHPTNIRETKSVRTCRDYRTSTGEDWFAMTTYDMTIEGHFRKRCGLLEHISKAQKAERSYLPKGPITEEDAARISTSVLVLWDPEGTAGFDAAEAGDKTLADLRDDGSLTMEDQRSDQMNVSFGGMNGALQELARGDFNGDGVEDVLVSCGVHAQSGSYRANDLMILTRLSEDALLKLAGA